MKVPAAVYLRSPRVYRNLSHAFAGQSAGVTQVGERTWLVTFMQCELGCFDDETCRLEPIEKSVRPESVTYVLGRRNKPSPM